MEGYLASRALKEDVSLMLNHKAMLVQAGFLCNEDHQTNKQKI